MKSQYRFKRCLAGILAVAVTVSAFSGCGNGSVDQENITDESYVSVDTSDDKEYTDESTDNDIPMDYIDQGTVDNVEGTTNNIVDSDISIEENVDEPKPYPTMWEVIPEITETPASDFDYYYSNKNKGILITGYKGTSTEIMVPEKIDGKPVIKIDFDTSEPMRPTELIIPDTIEVSSSAIDTSEIKYMRYHEDVSGGLNLEAVYFPEGIEEIYFQCYGNSILKEVIFPDSVKTIKGFERLLGLTSVSFPDSVNTVYQGFRGCSNLSSIEFGKGISKIYYSFNECNISQLTFPNNVECIADSFNNCQNLSKISLGNGLSTIDYCFNECRNLIDIQFGDSLETLSGFDRCVGLQAITLPNSINDSSRSTFVDCPDLILTYKGKTYPKGLAQYWSSDLDEWSDSGLVFDNIVINTGAGTNYVNYVNQYTLTKCMHWVSGKVTIPDTVEAIGSSAFKDCTAITEIKILPESVRVIEKSAFEGCTNLVSIEFTDNTLKEIGETAFQNCSSLMSITIPDGVSSIGSSDHWSYGGGTFSGCTNLTSVIIPDSVKFIACDTFKGCTNLTTITLPASITNIDDTVFEGCVNLNTIFYLGEKYENIDTFVGAIQSKDVCTITDGRLEECKYYYEGTLVIPEGVTSIADDAFESCTKITSIVLPDSIAKLHYVYQDGKRATAFYNCTNLKNITFKGKSYPYILDDQNDYPDESIQELLDAINYPEGYLVEDGVLIGCSYSAKNIVIPDGVTEIRRGAFKWHTSLVSVDLPESVTQILYGEFDECTSLTSVTYKGKTYSYENINELYDAINNG